MNKDWCLLASKEFTYIKPDNTWATRRTAAQTLEAARNQMPNGLRPYSLKKDGKTIRRGPRVFLLKGIKMVMDKGEAGPTYRVWGGGDLLFTFRESVPPVQQIDTNGNDKADKAWSLAKATYKDIRFLGAYVCKHIAGSYTMSQHSYGNAVDLGRDSMTELVDLAHWFVDRAGDLDLQHVIVGAQIWTRGFGWSHYGGDYHYHVHIDFTPQYSGSCGVRG